VTSAASRLVDWDTARRVGAGVAGAGPVIGPVDRAATAEMFAEVVGEAESVVVPFTELRLVGPATRPWVMNRSEWIGQNLRGFETLLSPFADRVLDRRGDGPLGGVRRKVLGTQLGGLLGYLSRKVLGQYDLFLPPDDRDLLYFVGPNVVELERRYGFEPREFRLWLAIHEVTHRVQFDGVPWLRGYLLGLVETYLGSVELDARRLLESVRRAREEARRSDAWRGLGFLFLLMTPEQRDTFRRMQAVMSLLEGHGNHVMTELAEGRIPSADRMRRVLRERRHGAAVGKVVQKAIGLDVKVRQYDVGERFVAEVSDRVGPEGLRLVWARPENLPRLEELHRPADWVARVVPD
jgi:coenzyme F420 biosynthesis associated uncharacterized protein